MMDPEGHNPIMSDNFYVGFYTKAVITVASCLALCPAVGLMGRRGGLLTFMIITALASLLQLGLLNCEYKAGAKSPGKCDNTRRPRTHVARATAPSERGRDLLL